MHQDLTEVERAAAARVAAAREVVMVAEAKVAAARVRAVVATEAAARVRAVVEKVVVVVKATLEAMGRLLP